LDVYNNFYRQFGSIFRRAQIKKKGKFHDCRSTALSNWFAQGLSEYEIMKLAGHSSFETTHKFYLAIKNDYIDKARQANVELGLRLEIEK
jgi:integrase